MTPLSLLFLCKQFCNSKLKVIVICISSLLHLTIAYNALSVSFNSVSVMRSGHRKCSARKGVLRNFTKLTGKHLCQRLFFNKVADDCFCVIVNLKTSPTNEFLTIEVLHITYKINEFSADVHFKLLTISKMKCKSNHLYLKMALLLSGDNNLNPGPVTRHQLNDPKFEAVNNKGLHITHILILAVFCLKQTNYAILLNVPMLLLLE